MLTEWQLNCRVKVNIKHSLSSQRVQAPKRCTHRPGDTLMKTRSGLMVLGFLFGMGTITLHLWVSRPVSAQSSLTLSLDSIVTGLSLPVFVTHAGDGSNRLFIVEQAGRIRIFQNGSLLGTPFLDIQNSSDFGRRTGFAGHRLPS